MTPEEKQRYYKLAERLLSEQKFAAAALAGVAAMLLAAGFYAAITVASGGFSYSFMAAGIGAAIGIAVQFLGRGIASKFVVLASILAIVGCLLGNLLAVVVAVARANGVSPVEVLAMIPPTEFPQVIVSDLQFADLIFWIVSIGAASYLAKRRLTREEGLAIRLYETRPAEARIIS